MERVGALSQAGGLYLTRQWLRPLAERGSMDDRRGSRYVPYPAVTWYDDRYCRAFMSVAAFGLPLLALGIGDLRMTALGVGELVYDGNAAPFVGPWGRTPADQPIGYQCQAGEEQCRSPTHSPAI